jgi:hypothetical protein
MTIRIKSLQRFPGRDVPDPVDGIEVPPTLLATADGVIE